MGQGSLQGILKQTKFLTIVYKTPQDHKCTDTKYLNCNQYKAFSINKLQYSLFKNLKPWEQ